MPSPRQTIRAELIAEKGNMCSYCGDGPLVGKRLFTTMLDPHAAFRLANLVPTCQRCHEDKSFLSDAEFVTETEERLKASAKALRAHVKSYGGRTNLTSKWSPTGVKVGGNPDNDKQKRKIAKLLSTASKLVCELGDH